MRFTTTSMALALAGSTIIAGAAQAELTGDLKIFLDTSNPAPRATMEKMIGDFGTLHPDLNIETTVIDREAYKNADPEFSDRGRTGRCHMVRRKSHDTLRVRRVV